MAETFEIEAVRDARFDEFLSLSPDAAKALADWLAPLLDGRRARRPSALVRERRDRVLAAVVANALSAATSQHGPRVHYSRARGAYSNGSPYQPDWLSYRLLTDVIDALAEAGFLQSKKAKPTGYGDEPQSTFEATSLLLDGLATAGEMYEALFRDLDHAPTVILKGPSKGGRKPWLRYPKDHPEYVALSEPVRAYNRFLRGQQLEWRAPDHAIEAMKQRVDEDGTPYALPDLNSRWLRRIFNEGRCDRGGRFYGGWWQSVPSDLRDFIVINGEPTVELDFRGFLPRAAYHREGKELEGDPYEIPAIRELADKRSIDWIRLVRPTVKKMLNTILNASSPAGLHRIKGLILPRPLSRKVAYQLIEEHHAALSGWFYKGRGLELMCQESSVCQRILSAGLEAGIPVLPVHDSFLVPATQAEWLAKAMTESYRAEFGSDPKIH